MFFFFFVFLDCVKYNYYQQQQFLQQKYKKNKKKRRTTTIKTNWCSLLESESESELFTGDTSKDNHSPGPVFREVSP